MTASTSPSRASGGARWRGRAVASNHALGRAGAGVVVGGHREAVGPGVHDGEHVALPGVGEVAVAGQVVAGLADGADEVGARDGAALPDRQNFVVGVVEARAQEVVHAGVGDYKVLLAARLAVDNARKEDAGGTGDEAAPPAQERAGRAREGLEGG